MKAWWKLPLRFDTDKDHTGQGGWIMDADDMHICYVAITKHPAVLKALTKFAKDTELRCEDCARLNENCTCRFDCRLYPN